MQLDAASISALKETIDLVEVHHTEAVLMRKGEAPAARWKQVMVRSQMPCASLSLYLTFNLLMCCRVFATTTQRLDLFRMEIYQEIRGRSRAYLIRSKCITKKGSNFYSFENPIDLAQLLTIVMLTRLPSVW